MSAHAPLLQAVFAATRGLRAQAQAPAQLREHLLAALVAAENAASRCAVTFRPEDLEADASADGPLVSLDSDNAWLVDVLEDLRAALGGAPPPDILSARVEGELVAGVPNVVPVWTKNPDTHEEHVRHTIARVVSTAEHFERKCDALSAVGASRRKNG